MKLSEAIRLGAMLKPQGFGRQFGGGKTCAIGAALDAIGKVTTADPAHAWFPLIDSPSVLCPAICSGHDLGLYARTIGGNVAHLNDYHRWTREQIADWVETIERAQVAKAGEPQAVETSAVSVHVVAGS